MATPYEFVVSQLRAHFPGARIKPFTDTAETYPSRLVSRLYHSGNNGELGNDYASFNVKYPGGYPFYYPLQLTHPGQQPLTLRIAPGYDCMHRLTRPDAEIRDYLAHYGTWRIEEKIDPATTDFWILMLGLANEASQYLILPSSMLKTILGRTHNPEKFSLLLARSGFCFAAQPLPTACHLGVLKNPSLLDTAANEELKMDGYLNNWNQLCESGIADNK